MRTLGARFLKLLDALVHVHCVTGMLAASKLLVNPFAATSPVRHAISTPNTSDSEGQWRVK